MRSFLRQLSGLLGIHSCSCLRRLLDSRFRGSPSQFRSYFRRYHFYVPEPMVSRSISSLRNHSASNYYVIGSTNVFQYMSRWTSPAIYATEFTASFTLLHVRSVTILTTGSPLAVYLILSSPNHDYFFF
ncbi:hypothetical protein F4677DRAFT_423976 [Hypoxylon crocopeplum]|nr:hypothetical protein F4677DRAFT_423976 [Hypoxylon crocopeplum]